MAKLSYRDLDAKGKRVFVRVDYNVPLKKTDAGPVITDDTRIRASLPTIEHLLAKGAKLVLASHLGRPDGQAKPEFSLKPVAEHLRTLVSAKVHFTGETVGANVEAAIAGLGEGEIFLLENVRFFPGEEDNDPAFCAQLAKLADVYVNDAFGTAHRAHASTAGVAKLLPQAAMGALVERELQYLQAELDNPARPFLVIMGGSKVSDKIEVIKSLIKKADAFLIGGAMAYTFRKAQGYPTGNSRVEADKLDLARELLQLAKDKSIPFLLPANNLTTQEFKDGAATRQTPLWGPGAGIEDGWEGIDIGEQAIAEFQAEIAKAKTIVWNGPVGAFEIAGFDKGTRAIAEAIAHSGAVSIIGGGDSVTAVNKFGVADQMTFISTGGGASLELLEGQELPGVAALTDK